MKAGTLLLDIDSSYTNLHGEGELLLTAYRNWCQRNLGAMLKVCGQLH